MSTHATLATAPGATASAVEPGFPAVHVMTDRLALVDLLRCALPVAGSARFVDGIGNDVVARSLVLVDGGADPQDPVVADTLLACAARGALVTVILCPDDELRLGRWVELGVAALLTERSSVDELVWTQQQLHEGATLLGVAIREGLLSRLREHRANAVGRAEQFDSLTKREAHVLRELALGLSPEEVANRSYVSLNTVRTQIRGVLAKLGVTSVVAAVALAYRSGWVGADVLDAPSSGASLDASSTDRRNR